MYKYLISYHKIQTIQIKYILKNDKKNLTIIGLCPISVIKAFSRKMI